MKLSILSTNVAMSYIINKFPNNGDKKSVDENLLNDIRLTPCQAEKIENLGISIPPENVGPPEDNRCSSKEARAQAEAPKWDGNWSDRYKYRLYNITYIIYLAQI